MPTPADTSVIRQWARESGLPVGIRGRLKPEIIAAYNRELQGDQGGVGLPNPSASEQPRVASSPQDLRVLPRPAAGHAGSNRRVQARSS